jgi:response regulator RpfG family c-di-GMP phosphodiesterase
MEEWYESALNDFEVYVNSFSGLTPEQQNNFGIKKDHSLRVAGNSRQLAVSLNLSEEDEKVAVLAALFHDIGRFSRLLNTIL